MTKHHDPAAGATGPRDKSSAAAGRRRGGRRTSKLAVLRDRDFRLFFIGYTTSRCGSSMAGVALVFGVLGAGGSASTLGEVRGVEIGVEVLLLLGGGVLADRMSRAHLMRGADLLRCTTQASFAALLAVGHPDLWTMMLLMGVWAVGEAFFTPGLAGLVPQLAPNGQLQEANTLVSLATSTTTIVGPALSGVIVAAAGPSWVFAVDASTYLVSVLALTLLRIPPVERGEATSIMADLRAGWSEFWSRKWIVAECAQFALFNMLTWGPYLILGPVVCAQRLGGSRAWGLMMACYAGGSVLGGLAMLGRRPRRPLLVATFATFCYALPPLFLALHQDLGPLCAATLVAGVGSSIGGVLASTVTAERVPEAVRSRVNSYNVLGAFAPGAVGLIVAGPAANALGMTTVFWVGAGYLVVSTCLMLTMPSIRGMTQLPTTIEGGEAGPESQTGPGAGAGAGAGNTTLTEIATATEGRREGAAAARAAAPPVPDQSATGR
jgi:MFS family permease